MFLKSCECSPLFCRQSKTSITYIFCASIIPISFTELTAPVFSNYTHEVFSFSETLSHSFSSSISISSAIFSLKGVTSSAYSVTGENDRFTGQTEFLISQKCVSLMYEACCFQFLGVSSHTERNSSSDLQ